MTPLIYCQNMDLYKQGPCYVWTGGAMAPLAQQEKRTIVLYINLNLAHEGKEGKICVIFFWGVAAKEGKKNSVKFSLVVII